MRLTKIQKALKTKNIKYQYEDNNGCADIRFDVNGKRYAFSEYTGNNGNTVIGILFFEGSKSSRDTNQTHAAEFIMGLQVVEEEVIETPEQKFRKQITKFYEDLKQSQERNAIIPVLQAKKFVDRLGNILNN